MTGAVPGGRPGPAARGRVTGSRRTGAGRTGAGRTAAGRTAAGRTAAGRTVRDRPGSGGPAAVLPAAGRGPARTGWAGLAASAVSVLVTVAVAAAGPSVMEPALPGRAGQPPWALDLHLPPWIAVAMSAGALAAGTAGLGLCLRAIHRGWRIPARPVLVAGLAAAAVLAILPPFGSGDHLSYAAYGRMVLTGHDPYTTTPAMLARLGDPVARAVQDWRHSPSVYGSLATGGQALASWFGGTSVRLTVFALSVLNVAAFTGTALVLHHLTRASTAGQLRAALLWAFNPLLLQVLVAGAHVDSQAIVFGVASVAVFSLALSGGGRSPWRVAGIAAAAGALAGLGAAVKLTMVLVPAGLLAAAVALWWPRGRSGWRGLAPAAGGLAAGFAVTAGAAFVPWGLAMLGPALHAGSYVSIGSPWRPLRSALEHWAAVAAPTADDMVKSGAITLMLVLVTLLLRPLRDLARPGSAGPAGPAGFAGPAGPAGLAAAGAFIFAFAWLMAWPYLLPWYDSLAWALLAAAPLGAGPVWGLLEWLLLARTAALSFGYLPARGITLPPAMHLWLEEVVRTAVTPLALLAITVALVMSLWPARRSAHA